MENRKGLVFSYLYLVGKVEKLRDRKLIFLVEEKSEMIKIEIRINF